MNKSIEILRTMCQKKFVISQKYRKVYNNEWVAKFKWFYSGNDFFFLGKYTLTYNTFQISKNIWEHCMKCHLRISPHLIHSFVWVHENVWKQLKENWFFGFVLCIKSKHSLCLIVILPRGNFNLPFDNFPFEYSELHSLD